MSKSVKKLKNIFLGQSVYILGSGPSVNTLDLATIGDKPKFFVNGALRLMQSELSGENIFVTTDERFLRSKEYASLQSVFEQYDMKRLLRHELKPVDTNRMLEDTYYVKSLGRDGFSRDLEIGFYFGCTSVMLAIQAAWYAGASVVYLVGVDLTQVLGEQRFYHEDIPEPVDPFYGVQAWNIANASLEFEKEGRRVIGLSKDSLLRTYIPYMPFDEAV